MGLFSSEEVVTVGTSISRVIKDEQLPDSIKGALVTALYDDSDLVDNILEASASSLSNRAARMYAYAARANPIGMPSGEIYSKTQGYSEVQAVLDGIEGCPVFLEYMQYGGGNFIHMAWMDLIEGHGYSITTNKLGNLTAQKGKDVYLEDMYVEMPGSLVGMYTSTETAIWGRPPNSGNIPGRLADVPDEFLVATMPAIVNALQVPQIKVKYTWKAIVNTVEQTLVGSFVMPLRYSEILPEYFQAKYKVNGVSKYWMYRYGAGTHPTLDTVFTQSQSVIGDFYPNIYHRLEKTSQGVDKTSARYKAQKKMSSYMGINYDQICDAIHENPDINDVAQAFMTLAVPADTNNPLELRYLYEFFDAVHIASASNDIDYTETYLAQYADGYESGTPRVITIRDSVFEMSLIYSGISKTRKIGKVAEVGKYTMGSIEIPAHNIYANPRMVRVYKKQITANFYDEIRVSNLYMRYNVDGENQTTVGNAGGILLVPLDRGITRSFNARDAEILYGRSLHFVFNSRVVTDAEWYQQAWFGTLLLIIAVVITVASLGADGGSSIQAALVFLATATYAEIAMVIAYKLLIYFALREGFKLFVKLVGPEAAMIVAIVAAAYGLTSTATNGATSMTQVGLQAQTLVQIASGISTGINTVLESKTKDLVTESAAFSMFSKDKQSELDTALKDLETTSLLSPFVILGENPSTFYKRTTHSGNIGTLVFDDIHSYVSRSLKLPDFTDTLGGITYV